MSQPSLPRFPFEPGHGPTASQLLRGIENRGFKQIKKFLRRFTQHNMQIYLSEKKKIGGQVHFKDSCTFNQFYRKVQSDPKFREFRFTSS